MGKAASQLEQAEHLAIVERDGEAFGRWLARHEEPLRVALRSYARLVDVEGIVQETALRLWQCAPAIEPDGRPGFLLRWAATVARNLARDQLRRGGREVHLPDEADPPDPSPANDVDPILRQRIHGCRKELPPRPSRALTARIENGGRLSDRQLAGLTDMTYDAFRQNLARARRMLERCLQRYGIDVRSMLP